MQEKTQSMMIKLSFYGATVGKKMEVLGVWCYRIVEFFK